MIFLKNSYEGNRLFLFVQKPDYLPHIITFCILIGRKCCGILCNFNQLEFVFCVNILLIVVSLGIKLETYTRLTVHKTFCLLSWYFLYQTKNFLSYFSLWWYSVFWNTISKQKVIYISCDEIFVNMFNVLYFPKYNSHLSFFQVPIKHLYTVSIYIQLCYVFYCYLTIECQWILSAIIFLDVTREKCLVLCLSKYTFKTQTEKCLC
jgi:hypothetical protein